MDKCYICGSKEPPAKRLKVLGYSYLLCKACNGATLVPRERAIKKLTEVYQPEYFDWEKPRGIKKVVFDIRLHEPYPEWIERNKKGKGKILDVGAGIVNFVSLIKQKGWDTYAQELSKPQSEKIRKVLGRNRVFNGDFEKIKLRKNFFDVVTFWHVLEHVKYPGKTISKTQALLKNNGFVFIEVPNINSLSWRIFKDNYSLLSVPAHLFYYSRQSLEKLLSENGFKIIEVSFPLKYNSAFAFSLISYLKNKFEIESEKFWLIFFYFILPISLIINIFTSFIGQSEVLRISAKKK
ncbi:hypothetical protein A3D01_04870 [Candidatus Woesebacteria bacterium RIFCSPHIGHO2_02_FULL_39_13]|uniref:Methyltransferase type 11 domain-containing protein n=1 Tax=Candidatus Woesebacteria bacterium RIFCSPHIGHO2_02_FULL_39_13 TaxID=1802505 RepID=A0A1F7Z197_9BACT|nr:MAG: hypothetical protein A2692_00190 [Candidatus Woesebacteria bacterium RIFCSPHIGHO2_01_FULL_39_95]OGM32879.1 MAG: hypothetical protein A3D01_04870 [Candidatus Woesebacteria bacterium RIFCSPHIGHO2_02_FULL_39_13]OGM74392.1 MAG: hypothetical protein A3H19_05180 [Candidatus Woesebacteria bacterium RIFCSPLOWO2_12_FULL_39_9]